MNARRFLFASVKNFRSRPSTFVTSSISHPFRTCENNNNYYYYKRKHSSPQPLLSSFSSSSSSSSTRSEIVRQEIIKWKRNNNPYKAEKCLIQHQSMLIENKNDYTDCIQHVLDSWCTSTEVINENPTIARVRAKRWLDMLLSSSQKFSSEEKLKWIHLYLSLCSKRSGQAKHISQLIEDEILNNDNDMEPTTETFVHVLRAWTRCRKDKQMPNQVMKWLLRMEHYARHNSNKRVKPNTMCYCMAMDAWSAKAGQLAKQQQYNKNIDDTINVKDAIEKVEGILQYMKTIHQVQQQYHNNDDTDADNDDANDVQPDTVAYNTLLSTYAKVVHPIYNYDMDIPYNAERIYHEMKMNPKSMPDERTHLYMIQICCKIKKYNRADWWLRQASQHKKVHLSHYNHLLSSSGTSHQTQSLLQHMKQHEIAPNTETFSILIHTSLKQHELQTAFQWLQTMIVNHTPKLKTTPEMFLSILKYISKQQKSLDTKENYSTQFYKIAKQTFQQYQLQNNNHGDIVSLDAMSFTYMMQILLLSSRQQQNDDLIQKEIQDLLSACCQEGYFSKPFRNVLIQNGAKSIDDYTYYVRKLNSYPMSWSRNVKPETLKPRPPRQIQKHKKNSTSQSLDTNRPVQVK